jgi:hypothetical protein
MERWDYWTGFFHASIENKGARELIRQRWQDWNPPKFAPQTLIPDLNAFGEQGWELVHMEPVAGVGNNGDTCFNHQGMLGAMPTSAFSNAGSQRKSSRHLAPEWASQRYVTNRPLDNPNSMRCGHADNNHDPS